MRPISIDCHSTVHIANHPAIFTLVCHSFALCFSRGRYILLISGLEMLNEVRELKLRCMHSVVFLPVTRKTRIAQHLQRLLVGRSAFELRVRACVGLTRNIREPNQTTALSLLASPAVASEATKRISIPSPSRLRLHLLF